LPPGWQAWSKAEQEMLLEAQRQAKAALVPKDPRGWARYYGVFLWSLQLAVAASVAANKRTVVRSAAGIGKSYLSAVIVCWWVCTHPADEVYVWTTAPGGDQVSGILWEDIRKIHKRLGLPGKIGLDNKWRIGGVLVASGRKPADKADGAEDDPDTGQGFHRRYLLVVLDDAGGLDGWLWDAAENITTGDDCRILGTGNPDHAGSRFARVCEHPLWTAFKASLFDSPNFTGEWVPDALRPVLTTRAWQEARLLDWGADDRRYKSKVLAEFPSDHPSQVIPAAALAGCFIGEPRSASELVPVVLGVDVGGGSDLTVVRERRGIRAGRRWAIRTSDPEANAELVMRAIAESGAAMVNVDGNGVGHGLVGDLRRSIRRGDAGRDVAVNSVMTGEKSSEPATYLNLRAEIWWKVGREATQRGEWDLSRAPEAEQLRTELLLPRWDLDPRGKIVIEPKDKIRERTGGKSPDDADALLLAYYVPKDAQGSYWEALQSGRLR
jgi:hypothetical protein